MKPIVVLGSGLAGYTLVRELRKLDRDAAITLISQDSGDFYSKPMLSNALAQGKTAESLVTTAAAEMARQLDITLLPHTEVIGIRRERKELQTSAGVIEYRPPGAGAGRRPDTPAVAGRCGRCGGVGERPCGLREISQCACVRQKRSRSSAAA